MDPKIVFIGGTPRGLALIKALLKEKAQVVYSFITQEDDHEPFKVSGEIVDICKANKIPYQLTKRIIKDDLSRLQNFEPDVGFVCGWRTMISKEFYNSIPLGCFACHDSILPQYRGFAPTAWAIINGEKQTGVTLFKIDDGEADSGDIFRQKIIPIDDRQTASDIYPQIVEQSVQLYIEYLQELKKRDVTLMKQDHSQATYGARRTPDDGKIDWSKNTVDVFNFIRALTPPYPYAWTDYHGEKIFIKKASLPKADFDYPKIHETGKILSVSGHGAAMTCGDGVILIQEIIKGSGETYPANKFFYLDSGHPVNKGKAL